ncbi:MAG: LacI family DNA-binding transcriptional regulator [Bacillota bacterium]
MTINISDVAKKAGVSPSTVSRALTRPDLVKTATRKKILEIVEEMSYSPNPLARGLMTGKTNIIALIIPNLTNTYFAQMAEGCEEALRSKGYHLIIGNYFEDNTMELKVIDAFLKRMVDGIIIAGSLTAKDFQSIFGSRTSIPVTFVNHSAELEYGYDSVIADEAHGARLACQALLERGARKIAVVTGPARNPYTKRRLAPFKKELQNANMYLDPCYLTEGHYGSIYTGFEAMSKLLSLKEPPDGVFAFNDTLATGVIKAVLSKGLNIPKDVAVVGFDDIPLAPYLTPSLTTIGSSSFDLGKEAAEATLGPIGNPYRPPSK